EARLRPAPRRRTFARGGARARAVPAHRRRRNQRNERARRYPGRRGGRRGDSLLRRRAKPRAKGASHRGPARPLTFEQAASAVAGRVDGSRKDVEGVTSNVEIETPPVALTVAGLDPSGGAGVIADVKTFTAFGCFAVAAVTSLTFQNTS